MSCHPRTSRLGLGRTKGRGLSRAAERLLLRGSVGQKPPSPEAEVNASEAGCGSVGRLLGIPVCEMHLERIPCHPRLPAFSFVNHRQVLPARCHDNELCVERPRKNHSLWTCVSRVPRNLDRVPCSPASKECVQTSATVYHTQWPIYPRQLSWPSQRLQEFSTNHRRHTRGLEMWRALDSLARKHRPGMNLSRNRHYKS